MDQQNHATATWLAVTPRENNHYGKISTQIYLIELDVLTGNSAPPTRYRNWVSRLHELQQFQSLEGRMPKRRSDVADAAESHLAEWVHHQCQRKLTMCAYAAARLEGIPGWQWKPRAEDWEQRLNDLATFTQERGDVPTPKASDHDERSLARWVQHQRDASRTGHLSNERTARLSALGYPMPKPTL